MVKLKKLVVTKLCGRRGVRKDLVERFVGGMTEDRHADEDMLKNMAVTWNGATVKACEDAIRWVHGE